MYCPPAEILLVQWTGARFPALRVATETPANLQEVLVDVPAVVRVQRYGGADDVLTIDRAAVDVDVFALSWPIADAFGAALREAWRLEMPGALIDAGEHGRAVVAKVDTTSGPARRPVSDSTLARCGASYSVRLHSRP